MRLKITNDKISDKYKKKICLIADIHYYFNTDIKIFDLIIDNIKKNKPDYICIPGDLTDSDEIIGTKNMDILYKFFSDLGNISKVFIIIGNHDASNKKDILINDLKNIKNITFLDNNVIDKDLCFSPYNQDINTYENEKIFNKKVINDINNKVNIDKTKYNILLAHSPIYLVKDEVYNNSKIKDCDLILCGHNHDGILTFLTPKNVSFISPRKNLFLKNGRGTIIKDKTYIIITGGVTKLSHKAKIFSLFNKLFPISINYIEI